MSTSPWTVVEVSRPSLVARVADYVELTKPKIALLELVTVAIAAQVAALGAPDPWALGWALVGTALVAASASAWNQWLERSLDARMRRTADRPLPAGRLSPREAAWFGALTGLAGIAVLAALVNPLTSLVAGATWATYVLWYTPLKTRTPLNTVVGAVAGALPVVIGWTAVGGEPNLALAALVFVVYLWQFPHFMAIAWLHRREYAEAGMRMLPVVDPEGRRVGRQAVWGALALVPVSLVPALGSVVQPVWCLVAPGYVVWAVALGALQAAAAVAFCFRRDDHSARWLLRASLIYLPALWGALAWGAAP